MFSVYKNALVAFNFGDVAVRFVVVLLYGVLVVHEVDKVIEIDVKVEDHVAVVLDIALQVPAVVHYLMCAEYVFFRAWLVMLFLMRWFYLPGEVTHVLHVVQFTNWLCHWFYRQWLGACLHHFLNP